MNPTLCGTPAANYWSGLDTASSENRLPCSSVESQLQLTQPTRGARSAQNRLASPRSESQLTGVFFKSPNIVSASGHNVIHLPVPFYLGFLLWHLWLSHPPCARVNTWTQLTHALTKPCTKRKVLFTNPSARAGYDTRSVLKRSLTGLNSEFSFS